MSAYLLLRFQMCLGVSLCELVPTGEVFSRSHTNIFILCEPNTRCDHKCVSATHVAAYRTHGNVYQFQTGTSTTFCTCCCTSVACQQPCSTTAPVVGTTSVQTPLDAQQIWRPRSQRDCSLQLDILYNRLTESRGCRRKQWMAGLIFLATSNKTRGLHQSFIAWSMGRKRTRIANVQT